MPVSGVVMVNKSAVGNVSPGAEMHICPNCEQRTGGDYCRWCGYPIITDDASKTDYSREDDSALSVALRRAAEKRSLAEKTLREAEEQAKRENEEKMKRLAEQVARRKAEERARLEEEERARKEAEEQARKEAEEKARKEEEERARLEAEERARQEARERSRREAEERARREAEEKARRKVEEKARKEAEARAKREAKEKAKQEAEAAKRARRQEIKAAKEAEREAKQRAKRWADEVKRNRKQAEREENQGEKQKQAEKCNREPAVSGVDRGEGMVATARSIEGGRNKEIDTKGHDDTLYQGTVKLVLAPPIPTASMRIFEAALSEINGLSMGLVSGSSDGGLEIMVSSESPVNIVGLLSRISYVGEVAREGKRAIRVTLTSN